METSRKSPTNHGRLVAVDCDPSNVVKLLGKLAIGSSNTKGGAFSGPAPQAVRLTVPALSDIACIQRCRHHTAAVNGEIPGLSSLRRRSRGREQPQGDVARTRDEGLRHHARRDA